MRVLLAGGAGYIGSALTPKLLQRGYDVDVLDLCWFGQEVPAPARLIEQDVLEVSVDQLRGYDAVVFMAGVSNDPMADYSPARNFIGNAAGPAYLAYMAKRAGVPRFVYASSCSVYGYSQDRLYDEDAPTICSYPYGISKLQGEFAVLGMRDESFHVIALRKGTVSGYSPRMRLDLVVNTMFRTALAEGRIVVNNPAIWRPVLSMQDTIAAYIRALECEPSVEGVFNIASGNYTVGEIADQVQEALRDLLELDTAIEIRQVPDLRNYKVSTERAERELGFKPTHDIRAIVKDLADNRDSFRDFDNPAYYNIQIFRSLKARGHHPA